MLTSSRKNLRSSVTCNGPIPAFILSFFLLCVFLGTTSSRSFALSWPLDGNQTTTPIANVYGQYNDFGGKQYMHPGVDFKANKGTKIYAGTDGKVSMIQTSPPAEGYNQGVLVKTADTNSWAWAYWHLDIKTGLSVGDTVTPTTELGTVHDYSASWDHLHLGYVDAANPFGTGQQNPLRYITYTDTKAPTIPNQQATPDKDAFMYYPNQTENVYFESVIPNTNLGMPGKDQTLVGLRAPTVGNPGVTDKSEIDVAVSAYDEIDGSPYHLGLYRMGYWIDGFTYLPATASVEKHVTFRFWDSAPVQTDGVKNLLYKDDSKADSAGAWPSGETTGQGTFWHIVTNTTDTSNEGDPNSSGLNADAAWKTVDGAVHNALARSPDGEYNIVSFANDLKGNVDSDFSRVRVDNFEQLAGVKSADGPGFMASPTYKLPAEQAAISPFEFEIGDDVYTCAVEELADRMIDAYLFYHQEWWSEGDLLTGWLSKVSLFSDSIGETDWGYIWTADCLGTFDIIFDYDADNVFSYTLDPLIGFKVVPEPETFVLFVLGMLSLGYLCAKRRAG